MKKIKGTVVYEELETGFWGIVDDKGHQWRPINMPNQLKFIGAKVDIMARETEEDMSIFMWGTPIKIISYHTIPIF
jgi:hypothetical protein